MRGRGCAASSPGSTTRRTRLQPLRPAKAARNRSWPQMPSARRPIRFFVNGAAALVVLLLETLKMEPRPEVYAVRGMIGVGIGLIGLKLVLRRYGIEFPPRR